MAPATRANPEREDVPSGDKDSHDAAQGVEMLREEAVGDLEPRIDQDTLASKTTLRMEKLESSVSRLLTAFESFQEKHALDVETLASLSREQRSNAGIGEGFEAESPIHTVIANDDLIDNAMEEGSVHDPHVRNDESSTKAINGDYDIYPTHIAYKIYQKGLQGTKCKRIGDGSFFVAKRCWDRLVLDFPTSKAGMKRLLPLAFDGDARLVFEEIANFNTGSSCDELWELLSKRLCNYIHQSALWDRFFAMTWNEKSESFERYAWRLRSASLLLPEAIDDALLLNRLRNGLPNRLQDQAKLVSGTFDEVVSRVSTLSVTKSYRSECVRGVKEHVTVATNEGGSKTTSNHFATYRCHYCQKLGHISRDCEKKKIDRLGQGKGISGRQSPAGPSSNRN